MSEKIPGSAEGPKQVTFKMNTSVGEMTFCIGLNQAGKPQLLWSEGGSLEETLPKREMNAALAEGLRRLSVVPEDTRVPEPEAKYHPLVGKVLIELSRYDGEHSSERIDQAIAAIAPPDISPEELAEIKRGVLAELETEQDQHYWDK